MGTSFFPDEQKQHLKSAGGSALNPVCYQLNNMSLKMKNETFLSYQYLPSELQTSVRACRHVTSLTLISPGEAASLFGVSGHCSGLFAPNPRWVRSRSPWLPAALKGAAVTTEQPARTNEVPGYVWGNSSPQPSAACNVLRAALQYDATLLLCWHKTNKQTKRSSLRYI